MVTSARGLTVSRSKAALKVCGVVGNERRLTMFVNLETSTVEALVNGQADSKWTAVAIGFLLIHDRNVAVGKIADAIRGYVYALAAPADQLALSFYAEALKHVDFYSIALGLIQAAEAADPSLVTPSVDEEAMAAVFARHRSKPVQLLLEEPVGGHEWHPPQRQVHPVFVRDRGLLRRGMARATGRH
jgi:predicted ATPase